MVELLEKLGKVKNTAKLLFQLTMAQLSKEKQFSVSQLICPLQIVHLLMRFFHIATLSFNTWFTLLKMNEFTRFDIFVKPPVLSK